MSKGLDKIKERGFLYQSTNIEGIEKLLSKDSSVFYLGIDPTADSLHIGHFFALRMFRILQEQGHKGILVIGGATALVGDPTGKADMRKMLSKEDVKRNLEEVKELAKRFIDTTGENPAIILDNAEWINKYPYIDFLREIGVHFSINQMLSTEAYSKRLESGGLTYLEMGYMLMQAYDFVYLNKKYGCELQIGGSDQWGNIVAGTMLKRKMDFANEEKTNEIFGLTCPLLMTKDGKKMGKTEQGTLWVAREKTTPYDFYQYFYNVSDNDVETLLKFFTDMDIKDIEKMCKEDIILAKKEMAHSITKLVHGKDHADRAVEASNKIFNSSFAKEGAPTLNIKNNEMENLGILDLMTMSGLSKSNSEARRLINQGGITFNEERVKEISLDVAEILRKKKSVLLKKGKKHIVQINII